VSHRPARSATISINGLRALPDRTPSKTNQLRESLAVVSCRVFLTNALSNLREWTVRASRKRLQLLLLLIAGSLIMLELTPEAHAASDTLTMIPARTQESNTPGVILALNVTGASVGTTYKFTWTGDRPAYDGSGHFDKVVLRPQVTLAPGRA